MLVNPQLTRLTCLTIRLKPSVRALVTRNCRNLLSRIVGVEDPAEPASCPSDSRSPAASSQSLGSEGESVVVVDCPLPGGRSGGVDRSVDGRLVLRPGRGDNQADDDLQAKIAVIAPRFSGSLPNAIPAAAKAGKFVDEHGMRVSTQRVLAGRGGHPAAWVLVGQPLAAVRARPSRRHVGWLGVLATFPAPRCAFRGERGHSSGPLLVRRRPPSRCADTCLHGFWWPDGQHLTPMGDNPAGRREASVR